MGLLDFPRIRESLSQYCLSGEGEALNDRSLPLSDRNALSGFKDDVAALCRFMESEDFPEPAFPPIDAAVRAISKEGIVPEVEDIFALGVWARSYDTLIARLSRAGFPARGEKAGPGETGAAGIGAAGIESPPGECAWADAPACAVLGAAPSLREVSKAVFTLLTPEGEIRDLPPIRKAREGLQRANRELGAVADSFSRDPELKSALQSGEPTQRDGRTVIAVRANFRGRIKGIVHEVSSTGQTVFIEPLSLLEKNNEIVQLEAQLKMEIVKAVRETAAELRKRVAEIESARIALALLDIRIARALQKTRERWEFAGDCEGGFAIWRARHPLLGKKAIPIDVLLPDTTRTLIVTGPNTGGKTVTLKTIGLLALMNQFAMALPVAEGTKFAVFDTVLADIGDEQSIDQSLSTFSGHMKVISEVTARATEKSLVLLDELGAGTDPEEGCAIAMGLLDYFIGKGSLTVVTTHHGILKNYGYTKPGCLNASMEFDSGSLAPTYRVAMGIPGESRALEIAAATGLSREIVGMARRYLAEERTDIGELIHSLNEKHREIEKVEAERRKRLREAVEDQRKADLAMLRVRQKELELRRRGVADLDSLLSESRKKLENLVKEIRETGAATDKVKEAKLYLDQLAGETGEQEEFLQREEDIAVGEIGRVEGKAAREGAKTSDAPIAEGSAVLYGPSRSRARVIRRADRSRWLIEVGSIRMSVDESAIVPVEDEKAPKPQFDVELAPDAAGGGAKAAFELDLRGMRLSEALDAVERQIDAASLQGLSLFSIVHGTGEGVLGKGIHEYLRGNPAVGDYHFARPEEGGYGKTIVRLKV